MQFDFDNTAVFSDLNFFCSFFIVNKREKLIVELTKEMREASRKLEFEQAAFIRDRISELRAEGEKKKK